MFCNNCGVALSATALSCVQCGRLVAPETPSQAALVSASGLSYGLGRFYAGVQIAFGLFACAFMLVFWSRLYPSTRHLMLTGIVISLPLGYGLWKRARWGLYLLTIVFVGELGIFIAGFSRGVFRPVLAFMLHGLMLYYCWRRERDFL